MIYTVHKINHHWPSIFFQESLAICPPQNTKQTIATTFCLAKEYYKTKDTFTMYQMIEKGKRLLRSMSMTDYKYHFNMLTYVASGRISLFKNDVVNYVLPHFIQTQQYHFVEEYAQVLAESLEQKNYYKESAKFYKLALSAHKKLI